MTTERYAEVQKRRGRKSATMTLGSILSLLKAIQAEDPFQNGKYVAFDFGTAIPTTLDSFRPFFNQLALGYKLSGRDNPSANYTLLSKLIEEMEAAIRPDRSFSGWKGGEYYMDADTPVWVANPGCITHTGISHVCDDGYRVVLMTEYFNW